MLEDDRLMEGDREDKGPYRSSVEPPPPSDPPRSARVLSALARLRGARGDVEESAALSERAARARIGDTSRPLGRCVNGHVALVGHALRSAQSIYESWLEAAEVRPTRDEYRMETLCAFATILRGDRRCAALRNAVRLSQRAGQVTLAEDAPPSAAVLLATTFRQLSRADLAARVLCRVSMTDVFPLPAGALDLERAHAEFSEGELDTGAYHLRAASTTRSSAYGERHPAYAECVVLAGRTLHRRGHFAHAYTLLEEAVDTLQNAEPRHEVFYAEAVSALAALLWDRKRPRDAALMAEATLDLLRGAHPSAAILPALGSAMSVFANAGSAERAQPIEKRITAIHAQYAP